MALDVAIKNDIPGILILDAFFPSGAVFRLAASICAIATRQPLMTLIVRAKKGFVAYFPAENTGPKKRGKPRIYGEKVKQMEMFDHLHLFSRVSCTIYGRTEEIMLLSADLLRYVISKLLLLNYLSLAPSAILKEIRKRFWERKSTPPDP